MPSKHPIRKKKNLKSKKHQKNKSSLNFKDTKSMHCKANKFGKINTGRRIAYCNCVDRLEITETKGVYTYKDFLKLSYSLESEDSTYWVPIKDFSQSSEFLFSGAQKQLILGHYPNWIQWNVKIGLYGAKKSNLKYYVISAKKLAAASEVFGKMLRDLAEVKQTNTHKCNSQVLISVPDEVRKNELDILLDKLRSNAICEIEFNKDNILGFLKWARVLRIAFLTHSALNYCANTIHGSTILPYLDTAVQTKTPILMDKCKTYIGQHFHQVLTDESWLSVSSTCMREITNISNVQEFLITEKDLVSAVLRWANHNLTTKAELIRKELPEILYNLRFQNLANNECFSHFYPAFKEILGNDIIQVGAYMLLCHDESVRQDFLTTLEKKPDRFVKNTILPEQVTKTVETKPAKALARKVRNKSKRLKLNVESENQNEETNESKSIFDEFTAVRDYIFNMFKD